LSKASKTQPFYRFPKKSNASKDLQTLLSILAISHKLSVRQADGGEPAALSIVLVLTHGFPALPGG